MRISCTIVFQRAPSRVPPRMKDWMLMSNPPPSQTPIVPAPYVRPSPMQLLFHVGRTTRLAGSLLADRRISIFRKLFFLAAILGLILALLLPESLGEIVANIIPFVGPVLGLPGDVALDWVAAT